MEKILQIFNLKKHRRQTEIQRSTSESMKKDKRKAERSMGEDMLKAQYVHRKWGKHGKLETPGET